LKAFVTCRLQRPAVQSTEISRSKQRYQLRHHSFCARTARQESSCLRNIWCRLPTSWCLPRKLRS